MTFQYMDGSDLKWDDLFAMDKTIPQTAPIIGY